MHLLCPHCHNPIELVKLSPHEEVICPSCGSSFRLEGGSTTGWTPREGQRKLGRFEILHTVGVGAFGTVYQARDPELDRVVAIKVPRAGNLAGGEELDRFLREARSVAQLRHPEIVPVYEVGQADGVPYLVSEFVQGVTLADQLTARLPSPREAAQLIAAVADALHYAHEHGVVHRDVKPSNILLSGGPDTPAGQYEPHVMDFGLAKREAGEITMTLEGQVLGTPAYMSPEQASGESHRVDGRSDVYSLGVILYRMLTGELPFRGNTRILLHQVLHEEPRPPRSLNDRIPRALETICLKAMAKQPGRRYATARDLADDLRRFLRGEPIRARPVSFWERGWRWARRRPAVAALLAALVLVVTGSLLALTGLWLRAEEQRAAAVNAQEREKEATDLAQQRYKETRWNLYVSQMHLAQRAWEEKQVGRLLELLEAWRPRQAADKDLRGFEWYYLRHRCHAEVVKALNASSVAFSPDGQRLACGGWVKRVRGWTPSIKIWDLATGQDALSLQGHTAAVSSVAFSPDGQRLASGSADKTVRIWDAVTGQQRRSLAGHTALVVALAFSPDGQRLASAAADGTVKIWDAATGQERLTLQAHTAPLRALAFSPNGKCLASASGELGKPGQVKVWDVATGQEILSLQGHTHGVISVAFSPDGKRLASAGYDAKVKVWDAATGHESFSLPCHAGPPDRVVFSPDARRLLCANQNATVEVWDTATGQELLTLKDHPGSARSTAFSPDGTRLASADFDQMVRIWDVPAGPEAFPLRGHTDEVLGVVFSLGGQCLASADLGGTVRVWDAATGQAVLTLQGHTGPVYSVAFSPDGKRLASASGDKVKIWDAATGQVTLSLQGHSGWVTSVAFSPDGKCLAFGSGEHVRKLGEAEVWDAATGQQLLSLKGHTGPVHGVAFSPDGKRLASASFDRTVKLWDAATGQPTLTLRGHSGPVSSVAFSPDGQRLASASADKTVKVWDAATGQQLLSLKGHTGEVSSVAFSPDGQRLASAGGVRNKPGEVKVWETAFPGPELLQQRATVQLAQSLVGSLFDKLVSKADVLDHVRRDGTLSEPLRQVALAQAEGCVPSPWRLNATSWAIVRQPGAQATTYRRALLLVEDACRLAPDRGEFLNTLGVAQYRVGEYQKALRTLARSDQLNSARNNGSIPADLALLAMTHHRLGHKGKAQVVLARLRETMKKAPWDKNEEAQAFLCEAEALLNGKAKAAPK